MPDQPTTFDQLLSDILPEERVAKLIAAATQRVGELAEDIALTPKQFAALMGYSERTLQDMRVAGTGPDYTQGGIPSTPLPKKKRANKAAGSEPAPAQPGTNQHVKYRLGDIRAWCERTKVSTVREAAIAKGQLFRTIGDLAERAAFYVDERGYVSGLVERGSFENFLDAEDGDIEFMPVHEGASRTWTDLGAHRRLAEEVRGALSQAQARLDTALEATDIASVTPEAPKRRRTEFF